VLTKNKSEYRYNCKSQLVEDKHGEAGVALVDLIVGEMEFDTSKIGKVEDPRTGGYMLTAENEGYNSAKEERPRKENELVHRVMPRSIVR
jgi:hypothetical protein